MIDFRYHLVSLIAVFIPLLFMTGLVGRMFREFALTLTIAVIVSAIVSLALAPAMCARLLDDPATDAAAGTGVGGRLGTLLDRAIGGTLTAYDRSLRWVLRHRVVMLVATLLTLLEPVLELVAHVVGPRLGAVAHQRIVPLGVDRFGQSGDIPDLYREYELDADAIVDAAARACLRVATS